MRISFIIFYLVRPFLKKIKIDIINRPSTDTKNFVIYNGYCIDLGIRYHFHDLLSIKNFPTLTFFLKLSEMWISAITIA